MKIKSTKEKVSRSGLLNPKNIWLIKIVLPIVIIVIGLHIVNTYLVVEVPAYGGEVTEGIVGTPRFVNPVFAQLSPDKELTNLVYSGLMRNVNGELIPDLAESYSVSNDGKEYTFTLKKGVEFHDGEPVKPEDIIFTIATVQDYLIKSPYRTIWDGVSVEKIDARTLVFKLKQSYSGFLANTTIGILPKHLWQGVPPEQFGFSELNIEPIGSGPFKFDEVKKDGSGIPSRYTLRAFKHFALGRPYLEKLEITFFASENEMVSAYKSGKVDNISSVTPEVARALKENNKKVHITTYPLARVFGIFFNQNSNALLRNEYLIEAINQSIDKKSIVDQVLFGYGQITDSPVPNKQEEIVSDYNLERAKELLEKNNWIANPETGIREKTLNKEVTPLALALSTSNIPELKNTAELIKASLSKIGIDLQVKIFDPGNLQQEVIRQRDYDSLLFGEIIGEPSDLYAFWHSSQRNDPGLNVAMYTNNKVDGLLEKIRVESDQAKIEGLTEEFDGIVRSERPAIFLYNPLFIYINSSKLKGVGGGEIRGSEDRFDNIHKWFINTEQIWKIFLK